QPVEVGMLGAEVGRASLQRRALLLETADAKWARSHAAAARVDPRDARRWQGQQMRKKASRFGEHDLQGVVPGGLKAADVPGLTRDEGLRADDLAKHPGGRRLRPGFEQPLKMRPDVRGADGGAVVKHRVWAELKTVAPAFVLDVPGERQVG